MVRLTLGSEIQLRLGEDPSSKVESGIIEESRGGRIKVRLADGTLIQATKEQVVGYVRDEDEMDITAQVEAGESLKDAQFDVSGALPSHYQNVELDDEAASMFVITDEWEGQIEQSNPFDEAAAPYIKANPGRKFRFLGDTTVKRHGKRGYVEVIDKKTSKPVVVSGMTLASIPMHVHNERARRIQEDTNNQATQRQQPIAEQLNQAFAEAGGGSGILSPEDLASVIRKAG